MRPPAGVYRPQKGFVFDCLSLLVALRRGVGAFHSLNKSTESKEALIRFFKETIELFPLLFSAFVRDESEGAEFSPEENHLHVEVSGYIIYSIIVI